MIIFNLVNLAPVLQLLVRQEALDELEIIIDNSVECVGSTAWSIDWVPTKNANSPTNYICTPQHQEVGYMHTICMNTYCTPLECVVHTNSLH